MDDSRKPSPAGTAPAPASDGPAAPGSTPRRRTGGLPSLAELGAFDLPPPPARPRATGRLTDEDLRGLPARGPTTGGAASNMVDASAAARAKPVSWPGLKPQPPRPPVPAAPVTAAAQTRSEPPPPEPPEPIQPQSTSPAPAPSRADAGDAAGPTRVVPGVTVGWADLQSAVAAGWMKPEAAHALWARWLARKPLTHMEAGPDDPAGPDERAAPGGSPDDGGAQGAEPEAADGPARGGPEPPAASAPGPAAAPGATLADDEGPARGPDDRDAPPGTRRPAATEAPRAEAEGAADSVHVQAEVLEPLAEARARRASERASAGRRIEVVDVIEVPSLAPVKRPVDASMALHFFTALLAAALAALCVGAGSVLFGPWGAATAALGWALLVWLRTARLHRQRRDAAALWGAHLVLPLLAAALWQAQVALGWWPLERPLDLFADPPAASAASAAPGISLDWRLLWLCLMPLLAAFYWLVRLREAALLAVVTLLLWGVAFQAVAGVLQSLGLAFHGMSTFALLLGGLTLAAALYIDLRVRRERAPDFARWPYLGGALLLGIGWVSLAVLPSWVLLPRYAAWLVFVVWALSLQRVGVVAIALALAGFELAWGLARVTGSGLAGIVAWVLCLAAVGGVSAFLLPRRQAWSDALRWWMPVRWRAWYAASPDPVRARAGAARRLSDTAA